METIVKCVTIHALIHRHHLKIQLNVEMLENVLTLSPHTITHATVLALASTAQTAQRILTNVQL
jgi:hypothetical protein